jgi:hypothetical protein
MPATELQSVFLSPFGSCWGASLNERARQCASVTSPLGPNTPRENIPQFVTFTGSALFLGSGGPCEGETDLCVVLKADDAVQLYTRDTVLDLLYGRRNPNSCPVGMTYFVSLNYTDYHLVTDVRVVLLS